MTAVQPVTLSDAILERFLRAATTAAVPLVAELGPGLSDHEISDLGHALGDQIPSEIRTLWRWRAAPASPKHAWSWQINPEFELWPPTQSVTNTFEYRTMLETDPNLYDAPPTGVCFGGARGFLFTDTARRGNLAPVGYLMVDDPEFEPAAPSLGALFMHWTA